MSQYGIYGEKFADLTRADTSRALITRSLPKSYVAITEIRSDNPVHELSKPIAREDAYIVALQIRGYPKHEYWEDGKQMGITELRDGDTTVYDLKRDPTFMVNNPFHSVHFYIPRAALNATAEEASAPQIDELRYTPGHGTDDPVFRAMVTALMPAFAKPEDVGKLFVDHLTLAVCAHVAKTYGGMVVKRRPIRGGLAHWQERRATELLEASFCSEISIDMLAKECELSVGHFSRAFRETTGMAPHQWLVKRRVEEAKRLMLDRNLQLSDIALACGFADQSHFTRVFTKVMGNSPGAWRRTVLS